MTDFWQDSPELGARIERVAEIMDKSVRVPGFPLADAVAEIASSNGKMLRPALILIGASFGKPDWKRMSSLAATIELLHISTLIHDDVLDEARLRRGIPTLHSRYGAKEAILAGDWLFALCFRLAAENTNSENALSLARIVGVICSAEIQQDLAKYTWSASIREYLRKIAGKTAALFSLALHAGASESKAPTTVVQGLRRIGYNMGMAFQIIDDILDYESAEGVMRKPVGKDLQEGLCTLPLIYALKSQPKEMNKLLASLTESHVDSRSLSTIIARTDELGGKEAARIMARRYTERAVSEIGKLPNKPARKELYALASRLLQRAF